MSIKVIVNGAHGKMGQMASGVLAKDQRFQIVGTLGRTDDLGDAVRRTNAEVVLDLTRADVVYKNACTILEAGARPVIGTSGLTAPQITALQETCTSLKRGGLIVPNFSLGVLLMMRFAREAAAFFPNAEIIEMHHPQKFDAPSSTAIRTSELIAEGRQGKEPSVVGREAAARGACHHDVPIHALRLSGVLAKQSVIFGGTGETLTLTHDSLDRQCFMPGVALACERVMSLHTLVYGLESIIFHDH